MGTPVSNTPEMLLIFADKSVPASVSHFEAKGFSPSKPTDKRITLSIFADTDIDPPNPTVTVAMTTEVARRMCRG
jgi:hypothetical protein